MSKKNIEQGYKRLKEKFCSYCLTEKSKLYSIGTSNGKHYETWHHIDMGLLCHRCYTNVLRREKEIGIRRLSNLDRIRSDIKRLPL